MDKKPNTGKPHVPTEEQRELVREFYVAGVPQERLARYLKIDVQTLVRHYEKEMDLCKDGMLTKLHKNLYQDALNGNEKSREFWLRTRGGYSNAQPKEEKTVGISEELLSKFIDKL